MLSLTHTHTSEYIHYKQRANNNQPKEKKYVRFVVSTQQPDMYLSRAISRIQIDRDSVYRLKEAIFGVLKCVCVLSFVIRLIGDYLLVIYSIVVQK